MTQEELYIWLLNCDSKLLPEFDPDYLKNYEIAKLFLEKFGINNLNKEDQKNLNLEAISIWFTHPSYITLQYDIPEILELLPERIGGNLYLRDSQIESLPKLESIGESLYLQGSQIQSLPNLGSVGNYLDLQNSQIQSLPKLESVGGYLDLQNSQIESLPELRSVGRGLYLSNSQIQSLPNLESVGGGIYTSLNYWKNYFRETGRSYLIGKVLLG